MNTTAITTAVPFIQAEARRHHGARAARWACFSLIAILAPLAILAWSDSLLVLSSGWRWAALVCTGIAVLGAFISFTRACSRPSIKEAARILDQAAPMENSYVVSTSRELWGKSPSSAVEEELLENLHNTAVRIAATAKPLLPWPSVLIVFMALVSSIAFVAIAIKEDGLAIRRALQPWQLIPYTTLELSAPADAPAKREPFDITGSVTGRLPKEIQITWTGGHSATIPIGSDGSFRHPLALGIQQNSTFIAKAADDGNSAPLLITLRQIPKVQSYHFAITPPKYTGWPPSSQSKPGFVILRSSTVVISLKTDLPAKAITFTPDNNQGALEFTNPSGDGKSWQVKLNELSRTFSYQIDIADEKSTYPAESDPQMIVVRPDAPPKFESLTHNGDKLENPKPPEDFTLKFRASDDIGLARTVIKCESLTKALVMPENTIIPGNPLDHSGSWSIPLKSLREAGVQPLDIVIVTVTAFDGNSLDGPGTVSEPIFLEMPFPPSDDEGSSESSDKPSEGEGQSPEEVNPLALQKDLHRQLFRASLDIKAPSENELVEKQKVIADHLDKMASSPDSAKLGEAYAGHLKAALASAKMTVKSLASSATNMPQMNSSYKMRAAAKRSAVTLSHLIEAAKIEAAAPKSPSPEGGPPPPPAEGKPPTKYSLIKPPSKSNKKSEDDEKKEEKVEKALEAIEQLQRDQEKLDKDAAELEKKDSESKEGEPKDGQPKDGEPKDGEPKDGEPKDGEPKDGEPKDGQPKDGQPKDGQPKDGQPKDGQPKDGGPNGNEPKDNQKQTAGDLAGRQDELIPKTSDILNDLANIEKSDGQTDPKQAAEALKTAKDYQKQVAEALRANNLGKAKEMGAKTEKALGVANSLTKSLLNKQVSQGIEAQAPAAGYESLIQDYSRRISYDQ